MPRFLVQRSFPDGLVIPTNEQGTNVCLRVVANNAEERVTWITSYVTADSTKTFCIYDGPTADSIQRAAVSNGLPIDSVEEVRVLDPYFYTAPGA